LRAAKIDAIFLHRVARFVRKDGTVSYEGKRFEVPYELSGQTVQLVVDPHTETVVGVENEAGESLGLATLLDALSNLQRERRKPKPVDTETTAVKRTGPNLVEIACAQYTHQREA